MGVVTEKYRAVLGPNAAFGLGDDSDNQYHVIDVFGVSWCGIEAEEGVGVFEDEEPSTMELMCDFCVGLLDQEMELEGGAT